LRKKINSQFVVITAIAIISMLIFLTAVFNELFKQQVIEDLKGYADLLEEFYDFKDSGLDYPDLEVKGVRITLVSAGGAVLYDTHEDIGSMSNHATRPEVLEALEKGEGESVRKSETLMHNQFYYAKLLDNGNVIRVSKSAGNIWTVIKRALPLTMVIIILLFIMCAILSDVLTKRLVEPIEVMASQLSDNDMEPAYEELKPFADTIRKQHNEILKAANIRQEFSANVSHELKTPLTSISGYAQLIENEMAKKHEIQRFAGEIHRNADRLLTLINDIIRLSELDEGVSETEYADIDLFEIAQTCVKNLKTASSEPNVKIKLRGTQQTIYGNRIMIEELVYNLCENAIKYNVKNGEVYVTVNKKNGAVFLSVKDTGIGIPQKHQERIFERFYRVDKSRSKLLGGTGLGLAIVKHIVIQHGAGIELKSEEGKGSEFIVTFTTRKD
jgi:two-component system phosphate regulon sensor histidine kinase PhoR